MIPKVLVISFPLASNAVVPVAAARFGMIERVEKLKPELRGETFANFVVLDQRQIRILISRGCKRVAAGVPQQRSRLTIDRHRRAWERKATGVNSICQYCQDWSICTRQQRLAAPPRLTVVVSRLSLTTIRSGQTGRIDIRLVCSENDAEWRARLNFVDTTQLPSIDHGLDWLRRGSSGSG